MAKQQDSETLNTPQDDFAKIVRATDGAQVLFRKGTNDDGAPCLFQTTAIGGMTAELNYGFPDNDKGWADRDRTFDQSGVESADGVRATVSNLVESPKS